MSESGKVKTTVLISEDASEKLRELCFFRKKTKSALLEEAINRLYDELSEELLLGPSTPTGRAVRLIARGKEKEGEEEGEEE